MVDASYLVPKIDVQLAGLSTYRSALPYSVSTSFQLDSDPFADRPEPRGSRRTAPEKSTDMRVSKIFRFGGRRDRDRVLGDVQRVQRRQLAALSGQPAVDVVRPGADRRAQATPAARVPVRFLARCDMTSAIAASLKGSRSIPDGMRARAIADRRRARLSAEPLPRQRRD